MQSDALLCRRVPPSLSFQPRPRSHPPTPHVARSGSRRTYVKHPQPRLSLSAVAQQDDAKTPTDLPSDASDTLQATLLIPHPVDNDSDVTAADCGFIMLSPERDIETDVPRSMGASLKSYSIDIRGLTERELRIVDAFCTTALHQMLYRRCSASILKSKFWSRTRFLPCRIVDDDIAIAWDVMEAFLDDEMRLQYRSIVGLLVESWHRPKRPTKALMDAVKHVAGRLPMDYPRIASKDGWKGIRSFVEASVLCAADRKPYTKLHLSSEDRSIEGSPLFVRHPTTEALLDALKERQRLKLSANTWLYPMPSKWVLNFLLLQSTLAAVVPWIEAEQLCRYFGLTDRPTTDGFVDDMTDKEDNRKTSALGNALLRFATIVNRWQNSNGGTMRNSKSESVESLEEIRNFVIGRRVLDVPVVGDIMLNWCPMKKGESRIDVTPLEIDWLPIFDAVAVDLDVAKDLDFLKPEYSAGRNFRAFVGRIYKRLGIAAVWDVCERIQLVQLQRRSLIDGYVKGWNGRRTPRRHQWETVFIDRNVIPVDVFESFSDRFGYRFQERHRFDWAMHHPSVVAFKFGFFGWMTLIGRVIFYLFVQEYVMSSHQSLTQTAINGLFSDTKKIQLLFDVAMDLGLEDVGVHSMVPVHRIMTKYGKQREAMRRNTASRNYLVNTMLMLIACTALDCHMDLNRVAEILKMHFAKRIDEIMSIGGRGQYQTIERYVPSALEYRAAAASSMTGYYRTDVQLCTASGKTCLGVMVLSKMPLPKLSDVEIYQQRSTPVRVKLTSTETVVKIDSEKMDALMEFQSKYFQWILPPQTEAIPLGERKKFYLVAPIDASTSDIDWQCVDRFLTETPPPEIREMETMLASDDVDDDVRLEAAKKLVAFDDAYRLDVADAVDDDVYTAAVRLLLFTNDHRMVARLDAPFQTNARILNLQCLLDCTRDYPAASDKLTTVDVSIHRCLPMTFNHFTCLASLPYVLELMEQKLLAEDYRTIHDLPKSISTEDIVVSLASNANVSTIGYGLLESIGHSLQQYLYTVDITTRFPEMNVGQQSIKRTRMFRSPGSKEARQVMMGHSLSWYFFPYKTGQTWCPPGVEPFTLLSVHRETAVGPSDEDEEEKEPEEEVDDVEPLDRVRSGLSQNFTSGISTKHFKVCGALCFLKEGPTAACAFLHRVGVLHLRQYPTEPRPEFKKGPEKYRHLEEVMGYVFRDRRLLARVFMHSSAFPKIGVNNECLEFVGDAVADLIMWRYIHEHDSEIQPSVAAPLKMKLTSNELFGWISASPPLELPTLLMQNVLNFDKRFQNFEGFTKNGYEDSRMMKIASDVFEALLGAVLVDSGYSIETVTNVMLKLMKKALDDPARFGIEVPEKGDRNS